MNIKTKGKSHTSRLQVLLVGAVLVAGLGLAATSANATAITASAGGVPTGADIYENFDTVPLGSGTYMTPSGIEVSFTQDGQAVQGAVPGRYAAPYLSGDNGSAFGGQSDGADMTTYLTSGATGSYAAAKVTLTFAEPMRYTGLLWGSVDPYNTLTFYNGATEVGQFTGTDVNTLANGDQGAAGTFYVNISLSDSFTSVVATSSQYAFEFDNVAISANPLNVPEPGIAGVFLLGLLLLGSAYWLRGRRFT